MSNPVVKFQILARDAEGVAGFYSRVFGWSVNASNALGYRELKTGGGIDGGIWPSGQEAPNFVQLFVEVDDVDAALAKATSAGARVIVPKSALPDGDVMAVLLDPQGMSFGICTTAAR